MPPPSPVWAWKHDDPKQMEKVFRNATFQMTVRIEGRNFTSNVAELKLKGVEVKEK